MANKKKTTMQTRRNHEEYSNLTMTSPKSIFKVFIIIVVTLLVFYLLTFLILNKKTKFTSNASINYTKILAGETFDMNNEEYLVFFYNSKDDEAATYADLVSRYRSKKEHLAIYTVDLDEGLNKKYVGSEDNSSATNAKELSINGATLVHIKNGKIENYLKSSFNDYLGITEE